jgi:hypothetical protein
MQKNNFPGVARLGAISFSINNKGYVGTGYDSATNLLNDLYEYDEASDSWIQKSNTNGSSTSFAPSFSLGDKGYYGMGTILLSEFWQYDPLNDLWTQKANYSGAARDQAVSFSIGNRGYIGIGGTTGTFYYDDLWEYTPDTATGVKEIPNSNIQFTIAPNPAKEFLVISLPRIYRGYQLTGKEKINLTITDVNGKVLTKSQILNPKSQIKIDLRQFSKGIYFVEVAAGKEKAVKKFLKE